MKPTLTIESVERYPVTVDLFVDADEYATERIKEHPDEEHYMFTLEVETPELVEVTKKRHLSNGRNNGEYLVRYDPDDVPPIVWFQFELKEAVSRDEVDDDRAVIRLKDYKNENLDEVSVRV